MLEAVLNGDDANTDTQLANACDFVENDRGWNSCFSRSSTGRFLAVSRSDRVRARIRTLALFEVSHRFTSFSSYLQNVRKEKMMTSALNVGRNLSFTARKCFTPKRAPLPTSFSTPLNISYSMPGLM